ncbi:AMP-binding protein [Saccharomonospora sp. NPDC006951]
MTSLLGDGARLVDVVGRRTLGGEELVTEVRRTAQRLSALPDGVLFARVGAELEGIVNYLAAFEAERAVALLDPALEESLLHRLVQRFEPSAVLGSPHAPPPGYSAAGCGWVRERATKVEPHPDLAVLLATSGSTGDPRLVRLSRKALLDNAVAIAEALGIHTEDVAPTSLPPHYSFGLSVLNSHLVRGATVVVEPSGILGKGFWEAVAEHEVTSLAGVPHHYELLHRMPFDPHEYPSLRTLTQAGGKLRTELIAEFHDAMRGAGGRMFVMYGQTEAGPRMATVPSDRLSDKLGSAGVALAGGSFSVRREDGEETTHPKIVGEVVYRGPNVMMGYATERAHLALGDTTGGVLATGDLGYLDEDGYLFITGRLKRIGTVFGNRVNLDDLEHAARTSGAGVDVVAAVPSGDKVVLFAQGADPAMCKVVSEVLADRTHLHSSGFDVRPVETVPLLGSGKINYPVLEREL